MPDDKHLSTLTVTKIPHLNTLVIKQKEGKFFISTRDSIVIDVPGLAFIIKFLVMNGMVSHKVLEGILDEYRSARD